MQNYKWDVVFACSGEYINQQLAKNTDKYVESFSYEDDAIKMEGVFGAWELSPGGSPNLLQFKTPITQGVVTVKSINKTCSLDGAIPLLQLQLSFIDGASTNEKNLTFNCSVVGQSPNDTTSGAVSVINSDTTGVLAHQDPDGLAAALLIPGLAKCLIANKDKLSFVFASVLLVPPQNSGWLTLKQMVYAYQQHMNNTLGALTILGMLTDADISSQSHVFDTNLLRANDDFGFILSGTQFLTNLILPKLPDGYKGSNSSQFKIDGNNIVNNGNVNLNEVKVGAIWYPPYINDLNIHIDSDAIRTQAAGNCDITGLTDAYVSFSVTSRNVAQFDASVPSISFLNDPQKDVTTSKHIPWWEEVLGVLTLGILNAVVEIVGDYIEDGVSSAVSGTGISAQSMGAVLVTWPGQNAIKFDDGGLLDNFYMRGQSN
ncbi:TULIP family P47-like protein [Microcystis wesenbergii]|uniref:TULIP family P47-like protein n=1 Tax=Microcystis wesenbergii NRERC-220 TaxID=3068991 RepID=A0ABU3HLA7_9CHRO|nr:TULIP family P47-like protein [Microcystis wesenbergii]MDT3675287.1 TULIP family P47-like protein [Microcystis wesenbergii NRERC-220]